jgi:hypothetical protein
MEVEQVKDDLDGYFCGLLRIAELYCKHTSIERI